MINSLSKPMIAAALFAIACCFACSARAEDEPRVLQAEELGKTELPLYRDPAAKGEKTMVFMLGAGKTPSFSGKVDLPAGVYEVTAWVTARPIELMHKLSVKISAGAAGRDVASIWFDKSGTYIPVTMIVNHPGGPMPVAISATGTTGFDGMRASKSEDEVKALEELKNKPSMDKLDATNEEPAVTEGDALDALDGVDNITKINIYDLYVAFDRIEIKRIADLSAMVTRLWVDKIHYLPGAEVKGEVEARPVGKAGDFALALFEICELDQINKIFEQDVNLTNDTAKFAFSYKLSDVEFGREILATLRPKGQEIKIDAALLCDEARNFPGSMAEFFGVSSNVYRVGITGRVGAHDTQTITKEQVIKQVDEAKAMYANYFEKFAWAPCDYSDLAPEKEKFWSGQTQYPGSKTNLKFIIDESHKRGIKAITYGKACAGGIAGFRTFRRHPEFFVRSIWGIGSEAMGTFLLEQMIAEDYGRWQDWQSIWCNMEEPCVDFGADAIIEGSKMFGWDGVRWDGHFIGKMARFKERVNKALPGYIHGYNIAFANPGSPLFLPSAPVEDFHECAKDHGMMMDESVRDYSHSNFSYGRPEIFYQAICREADYMKRIGGLPLYITFDMSTNLDTSYNCIMGLSGGQRYTYLTSPGQWPFGELTRFLTRYSGFVWDDTRRIKEPENFIEVSVPGMAKDEKFPLLWKESCWLRDIAPNRKQVLVNIVNPPQYPAFCDRMQNPSVARKNVSVSLAVPQGAKVDRVAHLSPDMVKGHAILPQKSTGGKSSVELHCVKTWSIVAFELSADGEKFASEPFPLTTPVEDAAAALKKAEGEQAQKKQAEDAKKAGIKASDNEVPRERRWTDYALNTNFDAEDEKLPDNVKKLTENLNRPEVVSLARNGLLDVHHCRGIFSWLNNVEAAAGIAGAGSYTVSWLDKHYGRGAGIPPNTIDEFPDTYPALLKNDVLIMDNINSNDASFLRRVMIKDFVQAGGGLLIFGGYFNLSCGSDHSTWMAEIMPVKIAGYQQLAIDCQKGFPLEPADPSFFPKSIDWKAASPCAFYVDKSPLKEGAKILVKAGEYPAIVSGTYGKGRVIVVMMNSHGEYAKSLLPYWEWRQWPEVVAACIRWLGEGSEAKAEVAAAKVQKDPGAADPNALVLETDGLTAEAFTKDILSACRNAVDRDSAHALILAAVEHSDLIKDLDILQTVVQAAEPYVDASFADITDKILDKNQDAGPMKSLALRIIGASGDTKRFAYAEKALKDTDNEVRRAAIEALGTMGGEKTPLLLKNYIAEKGPYSFLAAVTLVKLKVPNAFSDALQLYGQQLRHVRELKAEHFGRESDLYGGTSFKLTPLQRRKMTQEFEKFKRMEAFERADAARFGVMLQNLSPADRETAVKILAATESRDLIPSAYTICSRMTDDEARKAAQILKGAKLEEIKALAR